jgi:hypothetical protein
MIQLSATRFSCIAIFWLSLASFAAITLCVASQRMFIVLVYFVIDSGRKIWIEPRILLIFKFKVQICLIGSYEGARYLSGKALSYGLNDWGFDSRQGLGIFLLTTASRQALGPTQPPTQLVSGAVSLGVKRPGREADHSSPSSVEVKNMWSCTSSPPTRLQGVVLS